MASLATETHRDALTSRVLPQMTLSKGGETSLTASPAPTPDHLDAEGRAARRFEVKGNAM
jgi:sorbose reductase